MRVSVLPLSSECVVISKVEHESRSESKERAFFRKLTPRQFLDTHCWAQE